MKLKNKNNNQWLAFVAVPAQLGLTIYLFNYAGKWVDKTYFEGIDACEKWITLLGVFVGVYSVIRQVMHISNKK